MSSIADRCLNSASSSAPPEKVELDIAAFRPPELLEPLPECAHVRLKLRVALRMGHQYADAPHAVGLLRVGREWPRRSSAAEERDELAPLHLPP
jgi:hypothetical protein